MHKDLKYDISEGPKEISIPTEKLQKKCNANYCSDHFYGEKLMITIKNLFPFLAALGVFFLASNSQMQKKTNQNYSTDNEIKIIPVEEFKPNE